MHYFWYISDELSTCALTDFLRMSKKPRARCFFNPYDGDNCVSDSGNHRSVSKNLFDRLNEIVKKENLGSPSTYSENLEVCSWHYKIGNGHSSFLSPKKVSTKEFYGIMDDGDYLGDDIIEDNSNVESDIEVDDECDNAINREYKVDGETFFVRETIVNNSETRHSMKLSRLNLYQSIDDMENHFCNIKDEKYF